MEEKQEIAAESIIMELVVNSGSARSMAMQAVEEAAKGSFEAARQKLEEAKVQINKAHAFQTELIAAEAGGQSHPVSLIMVHGQDHLMTAMVVIDMAEQFLKLYQKMEEKLND